MRKYFLLYAKGLLRILPFVLCVTAILFGSMTAVFLAARQMDEDSGDLTKFKIGIVGTGGDRYLEMGLAAFESMDTMRFSMEFVSLSQEEAQNALLSREISAYVIFPEGFMTSALGGKIMPLKYVSTTGSMGIVTLLKDEVTRVAECILLESQKGAYGVGEALQNNGFSDQAYPHLNKLALEYVELVLDRGKVYTTQELGVSDGLGFEGYLLSGLSVLFLLLICMPYAPMMIRGDRTMERLLSSRGIGCVKQIGVEFSLYFLSLLLLVSAVLGLLLPTGVLEDFELGNAAAFKALPVVLMVAAWSFLLFEISRDIVSGVLLQFISALALTFVSGCLYPGYFFPPALQKIGDYLPTGAARMQLAHCLSDVFVPHTAWMLLGYGAAFLGAAMLLRYRRVRCDEG